MYLQRKRLISQYKNNPGSRMSPSCSSQGSMNKAPIARRNLMVYCEHHEVEKN